MEVHQLTDETARIVMVTRRTMRQKEVSVSMTDGRYGKNEIVIHATGLEPSFDVNQLVQEASQAMRLMQDKNPLFIDAKTKTNRLPAEKQEALPEAA
jgi:hypothetical protein